MRRKTRHEEAEGLSPDDLCDHRPTLAYAALEVGARVALGNRLETNRGARRAAAAPTTPSEITSGTRSPRTNYPGIFLIPRGGLPAVTTVEELSSRGKLPPTEDSAQYHDSELGDIYDLFNACNGAMSGGLLDVRKLDELTEREREALDLGRLRLVWERHGGRVRHLRPDRAHAEPRARQAERRGDLCRRAHAGQRA